jgi:hypothetical protein
MVAGLPPHDLGILRRGRLVMPLASRLWKPDADASRPSERFRDDERLRSNHAQVAEGPTTYLRARRYGGVCRGAVTCRALEGLTIGEWRRRVIGGNAPPVT